MKYNIFSSGSVFRLKFESSEQFIDWSTHAPWRIKSCTLWLYQRTKRAWDIQHVVSLLCVYFTLIRCYVIPTYNTTAVARAFDHNFPSEREQVLRNRLKSRYSHLNFLGNQSEINSNHGHRWSQGSRRLCRQKRDGENSFKLCTFSITWLKLYNDDVTCFLC